MVNSSGTNIVLPVALTLLFALISKSNLATSRLNSSLLIQLFDLFSGVVLVVIVVIMLLWKKDR